MRIKGIGLGVGAGKFGSAGLGACGFGSGSGSNAGAGVDGLCAGVLGSGGLDGSAGIGDVGGTLEKVI